MCSEYIASSAWKLNKNELCPCYFAAATCSIDTDNRRCEFWLQVLIVLASTTILKYLLSRAMCTDDGWGEGFGMTASILSVYEDTTVLLPGLYLCRLFIESHPRWFPHSHNSFCLSVSFPVWASYACVDVGTIGGLPMFAKDPGISRCDGHRTPSVPHTVTISAPYFLRIWSLSKEVQVLEPSARHSNARHSNARHSCGRAWGLGRAIWKFAGQEKKICEKRLGTSWNQHRFAPNHLR